MILSFGDWWRLNHPKRKYSEELVAEYDKETKEKKMKMEEDEDEI